MSPVKAEEDNNFRITHSW